MMMSLAVVALPGNRKRGFITADTEGYTCSTSSRLTKDVISISWRVPLPSQNPKFTENPAELGHLRCAHGIQPRSQKVRMLAPWVPPTDHPFTPSVAYFPGSLVILI